ncbi:hypothetical protein WOLCODRAFT_72148 [Wolfiporia cocos MD-104 SS10]|uniref:Nephrocystin 3-like N-terminal domain-containing protein n=1 Tax=Wolfiporia cocos (strain MD-104) TaxID=742152 RepID=A0A2H3JZ43_WOLCO|nr:hypothetical protein WOLCODRAFT_72148 [Wolfiporia cocos MD-104 SS10]
MSCLPIFHRYLEEHEQQVDDSLQAVCIILDTASDGLSFAPISGLDTAASALSSLITMIITTRENTKAKGEIADSAGELAKCIKDIVQDVLKPKLEELVHKAEKLSAGSFLLRCLRSEQNAAILDGIKEGINVARSNFMLQGVVMVEIQGNKIAENVEGIGQVVACSTFSLASPSENEEILRSLPRADEAEYRSAVNELKNGYLPGTRVSLLDQLEGWATGSDPALQAYPIYVLCGAAGTGKSTIAYEISKRLEQRGLLGASFFFVRGSEGLSSTRLVFPTIAYQLARLHQEFYAVIVDASNDHLQHGTKQQMDYELDDLIIKPLKKVAADHSPVVIVIDAVDECTELATVRVSRMLHLLMKRVPEVPFPLRILITTRPEMHIEDAFMTFEDKQLFILEEIPRSSVDEDIKLYISNSLKSIRYSKQLLDMRPDFVDHLTARSEGLFIYATTAVSMLREDPEHLTNIADQLLSDRTVATLTSLDNLYLSVLTNAFTSTALDRPDNRKWIQQILGSVALLQDHLSPKVLSELMNISVEEIHYTLARLGSVIYFDSENPEEQIRPLHASFPQFLVDAERCTDPRFFINPVIGHEQLAIACLELLNTERVLRRNILRLPDRSALKKTIQDITDRVRQNIPPHVQYACTHWATHAAAAAAQSSRLRSLLDSFCSTKLLLYLEALSAMNRLETAAPSLLKVKAWYQVSSPSQHTVLWN